MTKLCMFYVSSLFQLHDEEFTRMPPSRYRNFSICCFSVQDRSTPPLGLCGLYVLFFAFAPLWVITDDRTVDPANPVTEYNVHGLRMLWKSTTDLGCSIGSCMFQTIDVEVMVCNYSPA